MSVPVGAAGASAGARPLAPMRRPENDYTTGAGEPVPYSPRPPAGPPPGAPGTPPQQGPPGAGGGDSERGGYGWSQRVDPGAYARPDQGIYSMYTRKTPQEEAALRGVSDLSKLLALGSGKAGAVGLDTYTAAAKYMQGILGGSKAKTTAAIAPEAEAISDIYRGAGSQVESGSLRGGAKQSALAELSREGTSKVAGLVPAARKWAAEAGTQAGLGGIGAGQQGIGAAAGLEAGIAGQEQANRQFGWGAEQQNRFGLAGIDQQNRALDIQEILGHRGLDVQEAAARAQAAAAGRSAGIAEQELALREKLGLEDVRLRDEDMKLRQESQGWDKTYQTMLFDLQKQQMAAEKSKQKGSKWGGLLGKAVDIGTSFIPGGGLAKKAGKSVLNSFSIT